MARRAHLRRSHAVVPQLTLPSPRTYRAMIGLRACPAPRDDPASSTAGAEGLPPAGHDLYGGSVTREGTEEWPIRIRSPRLVIREPLDADRSAMVRLMTDPVPREDLGGTVGYASRQARERSPLGLSWRRWAVRRRR